MFHQSGYPKTPEQGAGMKKVVVIGGGFAGMAAAAQLQQASMEVTLVERHSMLGGRARTWQSGAYRFDMGPSWYLMPEVFDGFFADLGRRRENYYRIHQLDPSYRVFFQDAPPLDIGADLDSTLEVFEKLEEGGAQKLKAYLADASYKYKIAMDHFLYKEYRSLFQFFKPSMVVPGLRLGVFASLHSHIKKYFSNPRAQRILEYAMVFLGTKPAMAPALYSIMSHVDLVQGVFFPHGGMGAVVAGMTKLLEELSVTIKTGVEVHRIVCAGKKAVGVETSMGYIPADCILGTGDYYHIEQDLLEPSYRNLNAAYWRRAILAPSMFVLYLGVGKQIPQLAHHNLFFSDGWDEHFHQIFDDPQWPRNPSYYVSSIGHDDDAGMSPPGKENIFILVPIAAGLKSSESHRQQYAERIITHLETIIGESIRPHLEVQRIYGPAEFQEDYHALKGTALGLSHTLTQTAAFRPAMRNKKLTNLFYAGQYTHPGVGLPMTLIAANIVAQIVKKTL